VDPSGRCFGWVVLALLGQNRIFLKTNKADQKQCENWQRESGSEFHKTSTMCKRGEGRKQLRDFITQSLKQTPFGSGTISSLFWPNGYCAEAVDLSRHTMFERNVFNQVSIQESWSSRKLDSEPAWERERNQQSYWSGRSHCVFLEPVW